MRKQEISEEEKTRYRKGCLTGLAVAIAIIVLASGINQVTGLRTNIRKSVNIMTVFNTEYPKEFTQYELVIHVANDNFVTVKTNFSETGETYLKARKLKDKVLDALKKGEIKGSGLRIVAKNGKVLYDSTTRGGD